MNKPIFNYVHHLPNDSNGCHQLSSTAWYSFFTTISYYVETDKCMPIQSLFLRFYCKIIVKFRVKAILHRTMLLGYSKGYTPSGWWDHIKRLWHRHWKPTPKIRLHHRCLQNKNTWSCYKASIFFTFRWVVCLRL